MAIALWRLRTLAVDFHADRCRLLDGGNFASTRVPEQLDGRQQSHHRQSLPLSSHGLGPRQTNQGSANG